MKDKLTKSIKKSVRDMLTERSTIKIDESVNVIFPDIETNKLQILLIYEASKEMYKNDIKTRIVKFLHTNKATHIEAYVNSSIYFQMDGVYSTNHLRMLNTGFEQCFASLEKETGGKIFWTFNYLLTFDGPKVGAIGRGNKIFYNKFGKAVEDIISLL